ncbi:hypothetical protein ACFL27_24965 [candidate division CSSED10-310 bacterium]|uniref:MAPEG family protein n=1 Tax=candidate division CSSED10-310 bacterium TaxID=2855610 RepID=A0ABV6Z4T1_UNCC1
MDYSELVLGLIIVALSMLGWVGQAITLFAPVTAVKLSLTEPQNEVDPAFYADVRAEAIWDTLTLWTLPLAGVLLLIQNSLWPYFGMIGGGMFFYFSGRGIIARFEMLKHGIRIGTADKVKINIIFLALWGILGIVTIIKAVFEINSF